jgi:hypothetical protein
VSAIQPTISTVGKVSLSIRLERTTASRLCVLVAAVGVRHDISRNGAITTQTADQFSGLCLLVSRDKCVLCGLRSLELQGLVLSGQSGNLILSQEVKDCTAVRICVVDDVTGGAVDSVLESAGVGLVLISYTINGTLGLAAAVSDLVTDGVETTLHIVAQVADGIINTVKALENGGVYTVKALAQGLLNTSLTQSEVIQVGQYSGIVEASGKISLSGTGVATISTALTATKATAEAVAATAPTEQQQDDNPPGTVATKHIIAITVIAVANGSQIAQGCLGSSDTHIEYLLSKNKIYAKSSRTLLIKAKNNC